MIKEIVGIRPYSFPDGRTGELIEGYTIHLQWQEKETEGICCCSYSISKEKLDGYEPRIGDLVRVGENRYRKADFVVKVG